STLPRLLIMEAVGRFAFDEASRFEKLKKGELVSEAERLMGSGLEAGALHDSVAGGVLSGRVIDGLLCRQTDLRRRRALKTTDAELKLIANAANIGESNSPVKGYKTPAASGTPSALKLQGAIGATHPQSLQPFRQKQLLQSFLILTPTFSTGQQNARSSKPPRVAQYKNFRVT